jgi:hypothetical protein
MNSTAHGQRGPLELIRERGRPMLILEFPGSV